MLVLLLYLKLFEQLSPWIKPPDKRHRLGSAEIFALFTAMMAMLTRSDLWVNTLIYSEIILLDG
jgi:hypothetical protein